MNRSAVLCLLMGVAIAGAWLGPLVKAQDRNFAGSVQGSYLYVPTEERGRDLGFDGFTTELSLKLAVDFTDDVSANVKVCYGCHGFEADMAYADFRVADEFNVRIGRFNPAFGEFPLRHDPANHATTDKPLPYDMGRMLHWDTFNGGVLPSPYVDNGIEINGTHWFGDSVQTDYAVYAVSGFRGSDQAEDFNFKESRSGEAYYTDNNSQPAAGARLALTLNLGPDFTATLGGSGMAGHYDPNRKLGYMILGGDLYLRIRRAQIRAEYLLRYTEMALTEDPEARFKYGPDADGNFDDWFIKEGFYAEAVVPVGEHVELLGRFDGLRRRGNVLASSRLSKDAQVLRYTAGLNVLIGYSLRVKLTGEYYTFNDLDDEIAANVGVAAVY